MDAHLHFDQVLHGFYFYAALVAMLRFSGKRLAGQITTFDLLILISLAVTLQSLFLGDSDLEKVLFLGSVFSLHKLVTYACARSHRLRLLIRGKPRQLVRDGKILHAALYEEGLTKADLISAFRKQGHDSEEGIKAAFIEETGHISVIDTDRQESGR